MAIAHRILIHMRSRHIRSAPTGDISEPVNKTTPAEIRRQSIRDNRKEAAKPKARNVPCTQPKGVTTAPPAKQTVMYDTTLVLMSMFFLRRCETVESIDITENRDEPPMLAIKMETQAGTAIVMAMSKADMWYQVVVDPPNKDKSAAPCGMTLNYAYRTTNDGEEAADQTAKLLSVLTQHSAMFRPLLASGHMPVLVNVMSGLGHLQ
jgi:hypothetical protein